MVKQPKPPSSDRISILLDHIALHILSFLAMEDIARLSIVSKRWRALCISIPSLTFDSMQYENNCLKHDHFMDFLDRFILRRSGIKMPRFCVRWMSEKWYLEGFRVLTWLHYAVRSNVEVLDLELDIRSAGLLQMPLDVYRCESLRFLIVDLHGRILELPSSNGFTKLQSLTLKRVRVLDKLFVEQVLSFCESLDKLCLDNVKGISNINIRSSSLKFLEIRSYDYSDLFHINVSVELLDELIVGWKFTSSGDRSLKIAAPHLKYLTWDGFGPDSYFLGNLKCLRSFALSLEELSNSSYLVECFHSVEGIEDLEIHVQCLKALLKAGMLPIPLKCLHNLRINFSSSDGMDDNLVPAIALLLKGLSNLQDLLITCCNDPKCEAYSTEKARPLPEKASRFDTTYWESQKLTCIPHLKRVKMELIKGLLFGKNSSQLLKYIFKHARELEQIDIVCPSSWKSYILAKITECAVASTVRVSVVCVYPPDMPLDWVSDGVEDEDHAIEEDFHRVKKGARLKIKGRRELLNLKSSIDYGDASMPSRR